ncbi:OpgC family protein [Halodurantibacterium flavum]|uniref:OpgC family protein n=1 Tax=Halodurantibacterium flavum TaxID=1382802 RepID=A0ABW4S674_9RHOB
MQRLEILDGMRGYFLLFMTLNHLVLQGGLWLVEINHRQFMFVEDAQGFVFLSGFLIGLIQARRMERKGTSAVRASINKRVFELYLYAMGLIALAILARDYLPGGVIAFRNWIGTAGAMEPERLIAIATLFFQPTFMDILPQYIIYLAVSPLVIRLVIDGKWALVMTVSVLLWVAAQLGLARAVIPAVSEALRASDDQGVRVSFNPMGWQIVFVTGTVLGTLTVLRRIDWNRVFDPRDPVLPLCALLIVLFFLPLRLATAHGFMPEEVARRFGPMEVRSAFGLVYLVNFVGVAALLTWLVVAGPRAAQGWIRKIAGWLRALFMFAPLRMVGRHSLQIYAWHVVLVYAARWFDAQMGPLTVAQRTMLALVVLMLMPLPAIWREGRLARQRPA